MNEIGLPSPLVIVRGAGDISTGTIHRLFKAGFDVLALESERPSAIRRRVAFSEAVYDGAATVEGVTAVRIDGPELAGEALARCAAVASELHGRAGEIAQAKKGPRGMTAMDLADALPEALMGDG